MRFRRALLFSDLHLGWSVCAREHAALLDRLVEAADDAELIVLNGDVIDIHRGLPRGAEADLVRQLCDTIALFRREGRTVVYVEGNHDMDLQGFDIAPDRWLFDWEGWHGERIRVLHGHRFDDKPFQYGIYEGWGRHLIGLENKLYAHVDPLRALYGLGPGWLVGAIGRTEDFLWIRDFPARVTPLLPGVDVLIHGHFHYGAARREILGRPTWRTGAWVSGGHLGSVNRMLRYREGKLERIELRAGRFRTCEDNR